MCLEVLGIYCPIVKCVYAVTSECETIRLRANLQKAPFTETLMVKSGAMEDLFTVSTGVDFLLREVGVEQEEDDKGDADD